MSETAAAQSFVSVSRESDGVALIHLNRPPANSYNRAFLDNLNAAIDSIQIGHEGSRTVLTATLTKELVKKVWQEAGRPEVPEPQAKPRP